MKKAGLVLLLLLGITPMLIPIQHATAYSLTFDKVLKWAEPGQWFYLERVLYINELDENGTPVYQTCHHIGYNYTIINKTSTHLYFHLHYHDFTMGYIEDDDFYATYNFTINLPVILFENETYITRDLRVKTTIIIHDVTLNLAKKMLNATISRHINYTRLVDGKWYTTLRDSIENVTLSLVCEGLIIYSEKHINTTTFSTAQGALEIDSNSYLEVTELKDTNVDLFEYSPEQPENEEPEENTISEPEHVPFPIIDFNLIVFSGIVVILALVFFLVKLRKK